MEAPLLDFWDDAEEGGLAVLAAGVPISHIGFQQPQLITEGLSVKLVGGVYFLKQ